MTVDMTDRVAVITGAGRGLGRSHALALAARGARVVVNDKGVSLDGAEERSAAAEEVVAEIVAAGGQAVASAADIATTQGGEELVRQAVDAFGRIDALVNNAGILRDRSAHKMAPEDVERVLAVHLHGAFNVTLPAYRAMRDQGFGRIVNTTSAAGLFGNFGQANYGAAKTGLVGLTRVLAIEGAGKNVKVNAISPCATTRMTEHGFGAMASLFDPAHVSPLVVLLCAEACPVSGEIFSVGGGQIARIFIGLTEGVFREAGFATPEAVAEAMPAILDTASFTIPGAMEDEWRKLLGQHGREDAS